MELPEPNQRNGPLADHVRKGRVYRPQLSGALTIGDWAKDDLPDLLWPVLVLEDLGNAGARNFVDWQKQVQHDLRGRAKKSFLADCLNGRLTGLDALVASIPDAKGIVIKMAMEQGLLSRKVQNGLSSYFYRPAEWLSPKRPRPPRQKDIDFLASAILGALKDGHREALIKCLSIWSSVQAGTFSTSQQTIELLAPYPGDSATRSAADSVVRAMWGAHRALLVAENADAFKSAQTWARVFWGSHSLTTRCLRRRDIESKKEDDKVTARPSGGHSQAPSIGPVDMPEEGAHLHQLALDLLASYAQALETAPAQLHEPERQEVNAGLVFRAGRDVAAILAVPDLWTSEHASHITRMLVEVRIYLQWMAQQDLSIYKRFQDYGAGKAKLYARILEETPKDFRTAGFDEAGEQLRKLSHNDGVLDYRDVDTSDSFSGKSIRTMALEAGLLDLYRRAYCMSSGVAHSEWWSVELHAMERCQNVLHRGHLIPSLSLSQGASVQLADAWIQQLNSLIRLSLQILETDERAVKEAFGWLDDPDDAAEAEPSG